MYEPKIVVLHIQNKSFKNEQFIGGSFASVESTYGAALFLSLAQQHGLRVNGAVCTPSNTVHAMAGEA